MKLIFIGPPGAGKGTQAKLIAEEMGLLHISTGDILREEISNGTSLGIKAKEAIDAGEYVPDNLVVEMVLKKINSSMCDSGFILDGFPRTVDQAQQIFFVIKAIDAVIQIEADNETIIKRLSGRRVHIGSGRTYHIEFKPPFEEGLDDVTKEPLTQREDDKPEVVAKRLEVYDEKTKPVLEYLYDKYSEGKITNFEKIDGNEKANTIYEKILLIIKNL